jgi:hypothetical protein
LALGTIAAHDRLYESGGEHTSKIAQAGPVKKAVEAKRTCAKRSQAKKAQIAACDSGSP